MSITNWMLIRCSGCANNSNCVKFESFQQQITALGTDAKCGRKFNLRSTLHVYFNYEAEQKFYIVWKLQLQTLQDACIKVINTFIISKRLKYITEFLLLFCLFTTIKVIANLKHWYKILDYLIFKKIIVIIKFWKWCAKLKYNHNTM